MHMNSIHMCKCIGILYSTEFWQVKQHTKVDDTKIQREKISANLPNLPPPLYNRKIYLYRVVLIHLK